MPRTKDYSIREATEEDVIDLVILGKQFFRESGDKTLGWSSNKVHTFLLGAIGSDDYLIVVLDSEDGVVGMLIAFVTPCFFSNVLQAVEIVWYVDSDHRGSKESIKMLDHYEGWAKEQGVARINVANLDVLKADRVAKMYKQKGYRLLENIFMKEL